MRRTTFDTFDRPWLILCEGDSDKKLIDRLLENRNNPDRGNFLVQFPDRKGGNGGRSLFGDYLADLQATSASFRANVTAVLIVSDNDTVPANSFKEVQVELKKTKGFPVPKAERTVKKAPDYPAVVILMIPIDAPGNLETICVQAAYDKWPLRASLDTFVAATPAIAWSIGKQSKMRLQTLLAATCEANPATTLGYHWGEPAQYHLPLNHAAFDGMAEFLVGFGAMLAAAS